MTVKPPSGGSASAGGGWYVINTGSSSAPDLIVAYAVTNAAIESEYPGSPIVGPWPSEDDAKGALAGLNWFEDIGQGVASGAKANADLTAGVGSIAGNTLKNLVPNGWQLRFGNTGHLLTRILKVVIGGVMLLSGIVHLSGIDRAALGVAKYAVLPR